MADRIVYEVVDVAFDEIGQEEDVSDVARSVEVAAEELNCLAESIDK